MFSNDFDLPEFGDVATTTTAPPTTTLPPAVPADGDAATEAGDDSLDVATTTTTTTTIPIDDLLEKEFGVLRGNGADRPAQIRFVQDIPTLAVLQEGDLVETSGGALSLAPPIIPIGRVINRADRPGGAGPLRENKLNFVRVVLFRQRSEVIGE